MRNAVIEKKIETWSRKSIFSLDFNQMRKKHQVVNV